MVASKRPKRQVDTLKIRERLADRAALIARLNGIGERHRALVLSRNTTNEEDRRRLSYAKDSPAYVASYAQGVKMRENEERLVQEIKAAMSPRYRGMTPDQAAPSTPIHLLPPLGKLPSSMGSMGPPAPRIKRTTAAPGTPIRHLFRF